MPASNQSACLELAEQTLHRHQAIGLVFMLLQFPVGNVGQATTHAKDDRCRRKVSSPRFNSLVNLSRVELFVKTVTQNSASVNQPRVDPPGQARRNVDVVFAVC
jgi:hypothetical protein